ncbi:hypothetical protein BJV82DRAFT_604987 [Fennellomyces sp. T-0311]|nr:hypothetical protein BJV82DRAFT_604987 [Fennellomyces sp. T-0311]
MQSASKFRTVRIYTSVQSIFPLIARSKDVRTYRYLFLYLESCRVVGWFFTSD